ncbi:lipid A biosynthesis lauroyl acyltransferase [Halarcobacter ebronensis]|uniref:Lipid A biosynthesis acyltransferase n=1 Tax=Halarcobacter ebronensis TaxID=1462615 RepID=A0A4Q1ATD3_9BACT|nr:lipid A biosynthesis lauroyl acyltransferase [Halarcobacter ebronensis]QKF82567.1 lipid A biosynthesis lauroyl acyltransferase [Halarcobacter ebronensis]RXK07420.1 lipid A biosynthesis acyltransferase [Halarcobacter ebronensis]
MEIKTSHKFVYYLYLFFRFLFNYTPNFILKPILKSLAWIASVSSKKYRKIVKTNLDIAFKDEMSDEKKYSIIYESYKSLIFNMYEFIENQNATKEEIFAKAKMTNEDLVWDAIKNGKKIIFFTAHYGGWEIALPYCALKFGTIAVVNRKMNNPLMNELYIQARDNNNIIMVDKKIAAKGMLKALKQNQHVAVVVDQHIGIGVEVEFFGEKVMATDSVSRLALKFDSVLVPIFCEMNDFRDYTIKVGQLIDANSYEFKTDDKIKELTQLQATLIEEQIRDKPEQWFWQHKRFKHKHAEFYTL